MLLARPILTGAFLFAACAPAIGAEGATLAGPVGGTDIRSALLPPPGVYGGNVSLWATAVDFMDGSGNSNPALAEAGLTKLISGTFLAYVPDLKVFGGSVAFAGMVPVERDCGQLSANTSTECLTGLADPYVELAWSRSFGKVRPSQFAGAAPILEGLTVLAGIGMVLPMGKYDAGLARSHGTTVGNNIFDFSPTLAITYTTPPILAEGTELSAKLYWNNYLTNPTTDYHAGDLLNLDFALSERIGRYQVGVAGFYAVQVEDDELLGTRVAPDGRRAKTAYVGGVVNYDMPEHNATLKLKTLSSVMSENATWTHAVIVGWMKKF